MQIFDVKKAIRELPNRDKALIKTVFMEKYGASEDAWSNRLYRPKSDFAANEKGFLMKFFIQFEKKWILNPYDEQLAKYNLLEA